jgi:hypothetical protein
MEYQMTKVNPTSCFPCSNRQKGMHLNLNKVMISAGSFVYVTTTKKKHPAINCSTWIQDRDSKG